MKKLILGKKHPCSDCSECCTHVSLPIDTPKSKEDWHNIYWYVCHKNVRVFKDNDGDWYIEFRTKCDQLDIKGMCSIYNKRPNICREYSSDNCEKHGEGEFYKIMFENKDDVLKYIKNKTRIKHFFNP